MAIPISFYILSWLSAANRVKFGLEAIAPWRLISLVVNSLCHHEESQTQAKCEKE